MCKVIEELNKYAHKLVDRGLVVGAGGNLSMRDGNDMYISPSGFDLKEIEAHQWVNVDIATGEIEGNLRPSSEVLMHLECFRKNEEIQAVLHAHPTYSVGVSSAGKDIPPLFPDFPAMVKSVGDIDYVIPTTHLLAEKVAELVGKDVIIMCNTTKESAKVYTISSIFGGPRVLTEQECEDRRNLSAERYRSKLLKE